MNLVSLRDFNVVHWKVEATAVDPPHLIYPGQLRIDHEACLLGLSALARAIKESGAKAAIQLHHRGRQVDLGLVQVQSIFPSAVAVPLPGFWEPKAMS